jgi:hypothetical protein
VIAALIVLSWVIGYIPPPPGWRSALPPRFMMA